MSETYVHSYDARENERLCYTFFKGVGSQTAG